jgi:hypothetical protein
MDVPLWAELTYVQNWPKNPKLESPWLDQQQRNVKVMKMSQTIAKYPKYDDNILVGTKSTEIK